MRATGWSSTEVFNRTLKAEWSDVGPKPPYARWAYERHYITYAEYLQIPNEPGPTFKDLLYEDSPFYSLIKRSA